MIIIFLQDTIKKLSEIEETQTAQEKASDELDRMKLAETVAMLQKEVSQLKYKREESVRYSKFENIIVYINKMRQLNRFSYQNLTKVRLWVHHAHIHHPFRSIKEGGN